MTKREFIRSYGVVLLSLPFVAASCVPAALSHDGVAPVPAGFPLYDLLGVVATVLATALSAAVIRGIERYIGIKLHEADKATVQDAALWAANLAIGLVPGAKKGKYATNQSMVNIGVNSLITSVPDRLRRLGMNVKSESGRIAAKHELEDMIRKRLAVLDPGTVAVIPNQATERELTNRRTRV